MANEGPHDRALLVRGVAARRFLACGGALNSHLAQGAQISLRLADDVVDAGDVDRWLELMADTAQEFLTAALQLQELRTRAAEAAAVLERRKEEPAAGA